MFCKQRKFVIKIESIKGVTLNMSSNVAILKVSLAFII